MIPGFNAGLTSAGRIKKGGKQDVETITTKGFKMRLPEEWDHLKITHNSKDEKGNFIPDTAMMEAIKKGFPSYINKDGNLVRIPVRFFYNRPEIICRVWIASYIGKQWSCRNNGNSDGKAETADGRKVACPCKRLDYNYSGDDKCKYNSKTQLIIDGIGRLGTCWEFRSPSKRIAENIIGSLNVIRELTGGQVAFIPLEFTLQPVTSSYKGGVTTHYIPGIEYTGREYNDPVLEKLRQTALSMASDKRTYLLDMSRIENEAEKIMPFDGEDDAEVVEEFYPEAAEYAIDQEGGEENEKSESGTILDRTVEEVETVQENSDRLAEKSGVVQENTESESEEKSEKNQVGEQSVESEPKSEKSEIVQGIELYEFLKLKESGFRSFIKENAERIKITDGAILNEMIGKWNRIITPAEDWPYPIDDAENMSADQQPAEQEQPASTDKPEPIPFGGLQDEIVATFKKIAAADRKVWIAALESVGVVVPVQDIDVIIRHKEKWNDADTWKNMIATHAPKTDVSNVVENTLELLSKTDGSKYTWMKCMAEFGISSAKDLPDRKTAEDFLRKLGDDIPF